MAIKLNNYNGRRASRNALISEINVTPLVDVMLVLLIVFMITAPMLVSGIKVNLPQIDSITRSSTNQYETKRKNHRNLH